ncbi:hypothetical protein N665_0401s0010 [Sinapis alba]|nr:hypothetical protein N665_0401s0010 [Sinapis alba]
MVVLVMHTSSICTIGGSPTKQNKFGSPTKLRLWFLCSSYGDSSSNLASGVLFVFDLEQQTFTDNISSNITSQRLMQTETLQVVNNHVKLTMNHEDH